MLQTFFLYESSIDFFIPPQSKLDPRFSRVSNEWIRLSTNYTMSRWIVLFLACTPFHEGPNVSIMLIFMSIHWYPYGLPHWCLLNARSLNRERKIGTPSLVSMVEAPKVENVLSGMERVETIEKECDMGASTGSRGLESIMNLTLYLDTSPRVILKELKVSIQMWLMENE